MSLFKREDAGRWFAVCLLLIAVNVAYAAPVTPNQAADVAAIQAQLITQRFDQANRLYADMSFDLSSSDPQPLYDEEGGELLAYVFDLAPQGFVVVTASTDLVPVITYSHTGSFPWEEDPLNLLLHMLRHDLSLRMKARDLVDESRIQAYHDQWDDYLSGKILLLAPGDSWPPDGQTITGGWVETQWHQRSPYNDECPIDPVTSDRCVVGCVATAMGQIVNFWQYPDSVIFSTLDSYTTETRGISIDATEASIPEIDYNDGFPSFATCADISYACGVSVYMDYTSVGSGANHWDCAQGYRMDFDYDVADWKDADDWDFYDVLEQNMKDSMPAQLGIVSSQYGHSIVCDGFRETVTDDEWHLNFGWGSSNPDPLTQSWYTLPGGMPAGFTTVVDGVVNIEAPYRPGPLPEPPVADFDATPRTGSAPLTVQFSDLSTNNPTSWSWTFGDGGTSTDQNPSYEYTTAGTYDVSLIATNADGSDTETKTGFITVTDQPPPPPQAGFSADPTSGNAPLTVQFTDNSTDAATWSWDFGDGNSSTLQNPSNTYNNPGTYNVSLTVTNESGNDTHTEPDYITVFTPGQPPVAAFSMTPTIAYVPVTSQVLVSFTNESTGQIDSLLWNFGDGAVSTVQDPSHLYTSADSFRVTLYVENADGNNTATHTVYICVTPEDFTVTPVLASVAQDIVEIPYTLPYKTKADFSLYDVNGQLVRRFYTDEQPPGNYTLSWDLTDRRGFTVSPGVYFLHLAASGGGADAKIIVVR